MFGTIEGTHNKLMEKISLIKNSLELLKDISNTYRGIVIAKPGKKSTDCLVILNNLQINLNIDSLEIIENDYGLSVVPILGEYYTSSIGENKNTRDYYRAITSDNFCGKIEDAILRTRLIISNIYKVMYNHVANKSTIKETEYELEIISKKLEHAQCIEINIQLEKRNYEVCKCGNRMTVIPELSELRCDMCCKTKKIIGAVFRDDQFYPQEGQKTKHGGYDTTRHYKFWMERLQALESKTFCDADVINIEYVITRDNHDRKEINCETMRYILKDPIVGATHLNDHAPLLVKIFGGLPPPQLDFQENRLTAIRFNKAMKLYDEVNPDGGNKPYYPYFIYKILEHMFKEFPEKLRILEYIHLQSRETVIKNDKYYMQMCTMSGAEDGLIYTPTDPNRY